METGPRHPVSIAPERFKVARPGETPDSREMETVNKTYRNVVRGIVYAENGAIVDPNYANVDAIRNEDAWKGKPEDEIIQEWQRRDELVKKVNARPLIPEEQALKDAYALIYQKDAHIERLYQERLAQAEAEFKRQNPQTQLSDKQKEDILSEIINGYKSRTDAIDDSSAYVPIVDELKRLADPDNQQPSETALEARQHLSVLKLVDGPNGPDGKPIKVFEVKSREQVTAEAEPILKDAGYRYLGTRLSQELAAKIQDGILTKEVLEEINRNPDVHVVNVANLIYFSNHAAELGLNEDQRANVSTAIYFELNALQNDPQQHQEIRNSIGAIDNYQHIYQERYMGIAKRAGADLVEADVDIRTMSPAELTETVTWASICESGGLEIRSGRFALKEEISDKIETGTMRVNVLKIASAGKGRRILSREYGMTEEVQKKVNKADVVGETVSALLNQEIISAENAGGIRQILAAHFAGMDEKHKRKFGITGVGILMALFAPQIQAMLNEGIEPAEAGGGHRG